MGGGGLSHIGVNIQILLGYLVTHCLLVCHLTLAGGRLTQERTSVSPNISSSGKAVGGHLTHG